MADPTIYTTGYSGITADNLAEFLRREFSEQEQTQATVIIAQVEAEIANRCRRQFSYIDSESEPIEYEEVFDLPATTVFTNAFPIASIEQIEVDGVVQTLVANTDYYLYDSYIEFVNGLSGYKRGLTLTYTIKKFWGDDLNTAILKMAGHLWLNAEDSGMGKREISFASIRQIMDTSTFENQIKAVVDRYKKRLI